MDINHPNASPLSEQEQMVFEHFQKRLESMVSSHGLTEGDVKELIRELRSHPLISSQLWQEAGMELTRMLPDQRSILSGIDRCEHLGLGWCSRLLRFFWL